MADIEKVNEVELLARGLGIHFDKIARATKEQMLKQYHGVVKNQQNRKAGDPNLLEGVVGHLTSLSSAALILQEGSLGVRSAAVGQNAGGLSVINKPISDLGWLPFGPRSWRESIGKALWGSNAEEVINEKGTHGDKLQVLLLLSFPPELLKWLNEGDGPGRVDGRDAITIIPPRYLYGARDGHRYLGHKDILAVLVLQPMPDELVKPGKTEKEPQDLKLNTICWEINADYEGLRFVHKDPWVASVDGFLSPEECNAFIAHAGPRLHQREQNDSLGNPRRKDLQVQVPTSHTPKINSRIAKLLNMDFAQLEDSQLIKYNPGGFFKTHQDMTGNRCVTVFVYLADTQPGSGETYFPGLGLTFQPKQGTAIIFPCGPSHPDLIPEWHDRSLYIMRHEAKPVLEGDVKHIFACIGQSLPIMNRAVPRWHPDEADENVKLL